MRFGQPKYMGAELRGLLHIGKLPTILALPARSGPGWLPGSPERTRPCLCSAANGIVRSTRKGRATVAAVWALHLVAPVFTIACGRTALAPQGRGACRLCLEPRDGSPFRLALGSGKRPHGDRMELQVAEFKRLTETVLPALAREQHWPIRLDHCFKRICLDHAFGGVWYHFLPRPAERHLHGPALERAIACAEEIAAEGRPTLDERNTASLRFRGKLH